ncbi:UDP-glycosyltransferase 74B1-like [Senna tora]|uniref:UDP-glycosyltransferase 74B1-like n=1 Tax=Senna tora TaxID=362788 RepID=A0A834STP4_9FABA|nr:UDP-glycosyltransferase 74B1-like [Senna tora]
MGLKSHTHTVHVVVVPYPSQGHINPLLQFAKRLASKGVKATIATTKYTLHSISASNVAVEPISDGFDDSGFAQAKTVHSFLTSFRSHGSRTLSRLVEKFQRSPYPVTCIVYDSFLPWALEVAKRHGVYGATFFTNSAAVCSMFCRIQRGMLELPVKKEEVPLVVPGLPPLEWEDLPSFVRAPESYPAYLAMKLSQFSNVDKADWMFVNTFQPLETEVCGETHIGNIAGEADRSDGSVGILRRQNIGRQRLRRQPVEASKRTVCEMARIEATSLRGLRLFRKHGLLNRPTNPRTRTRLARERKEFPVGPTRIRERETAPFLHGVRYATWHGGDVVQPAGAAGPRVGGLLREPLRLEFDAGRAEPGRAHGGYAPVGGPIDGREVRGGSVGGGREGEGGREWGSEEGRDSEVFGGSDGGREK